MVTIEPDKPILNVTARNQAENRSTVKKGEFESIFRQTVDATEVKGAEASSTHFISSVRPPQFAAESLPSVNMVVDQVQRLIDTMGDYQQQLMEKGATLKGIQGLVEQMESQRDALSAASDTLSDQTGLKTIVNQSLSLASMEIAKFNNGYYIDE